MLSDSLLGTNKKLWQFIVASHLKLRSLKILWRIFNPLLAFFKADRLSVTEIQCRPAECVALWLVHLFELQAISKCRISFKRENSLSSDFPDNEMRRFACLNTITVLKPVRETRLATHFNWIRSRLVILEKAHHRRIQFVFEQIQYRPGL